MKLFEHYSLKRIFRPLPVRNMLQNSKSNTAITSIFRAFRFVDELFVRPGFAGFEWWNSAKLTVEKSDALAFLAIDEEWPELELVSPLSDIEIIPNLANKPVCFA